YQLLLCLRGDTDHKALTGISSGAAIASRLEPRHLAAARLPEFRIQCPPSFAATGQDAYSEPVAIFTGPPERAELRMDLVECMECLTDRASEAFAAIQAVFDESGVVHNVDFQPGQALVLANRRITHSRTVFTPRYDGTDRWLQRMFILSDPFQFRALVDHRVRII
ncbi:MAG: TauD/TfdA family dioxygenase, partial [Gemmatimonadales bacterium]